MQWEYKTIEIELKGFFTKKLDEQKLNLLNDLGKDGWELVSSTAIATGGPTTQVILAIFKRKKN